MQIRNDFNSYSGTEYRQSHTHHITKNPHGEEHKKPESGEGAAAGVKMDPLPTNGAEEKSRQTTMPGYGEEAPRRNISVKKGLQFVKDLWDSMGDEKEPEEEEQQAVKEEGDPADGADAAASAIRQGFPGYIVNKWELVREKVMTVFHSVLKRFGRESGAFSALADPNNGKKENRETFTEKDKKGAHRGKTDMITASMADSHLMDSYSKNGKYCRLGENLTYQKNVPEKKSLNGE